MASKEEIAGLSRVIDETVLDDSIRLGIARRVADVLTSNKDFSRDKFVNESTKTKRSYVHPH